LVSHAGSALLAQVADKLGLARALSLRLAGLKQRRRGHDPGRVIRDLAVMLADGGECVLDLGAVRDQEALFGPVASDSTAFRVVDRIASEPELLDALRGAHARARARFWKLHGAPERLTIDIDATLITAHSENERRPVTTRAGFHPLQAYCDETREALGAMLRPVNSGPRPLASWMLNFLCQGSRTRLTPPISAPCLAHRRSPTARCASRRAAPLLVVRCWIACRLLRRRAGVRCWRVVGGLRRPSAGSRLVNRWRPC
jgi:hypothetical protein